MPDYYPAGLDKSSHAVLHNLLKSTHRNVIPYTAYSLDTWDALIQLDSTDPPANTQVHLIYRNVPMSSSLSGVSVGGWNREHCWPKSVGVGFDGPDFTDLHHLRPSDWDVNTARTNRFYGDCLSSSIAAGKCNAPATDECPADTMSDGIEYRWTPPSSARGDIARAMFYMALRYDGEDDPDGKDLKLSDCPVGSLAIHGYLSDLLRWHAADPVDASERQRNDDVCTKYQGVRNPFVDFPELVKVHYGSPVVPAGEKKSDCPWQTASPTKAPSIAGGSTTPSPHESATRSPSLAPSRAKSSAPAPASLLDGEKEGVSIAVVGGGVAGALVAVGAVALYLAKCRGAGGGAGASKYSGAMTGKNEPSSRKPVPARPPPFNRNANTGDKKNIAKNRQGKQMEMI